MKYVMCIVFCCLLCLGKAQQRVTGQKPGITAPPLELKLNPFYKKYLNANGIHIIASWRVPDSAMYAAHRTLTALTGYLPAGVLKAMTDIGTRVGVMARYEGTTDIPEHAHLARDTSLNWDLRARGLGGTKWLPLTTCAEENILGYQIDKYHAEDILVHEFAHSIHLIGILTVYPDFNERLKKAYDAALAAGKWKDTYAATPPPESTRRNAAAFMKVSWTRCGSSYRGPRWWPWARSASTTTGRKIRLGSFKKQCSASSLHWRRS